jgi:hypothetical protein
MGNITADISLMVCAEALHVHFFWESQRCNLMRRSKLEGLYTRACTRFARMKCISRTLAVAKILRTG